MQVLTLRRRKEKRQKQKIKRSLINCYNCIESSRRLPSIGNLPQGQIYCHVWMCIVFPTHAKICPYFEPIRRR